MNAIQRLVALKHVHANLSRRIETLESLIDTNAEEPHDHVMIAEGKDRLEALDWAQRVIRAALVILVERTPEGISDTLLDELQKAAE